MDEKVFALDIGTRKIVGLVMERNGDSYKVIGSEMREHQTRAMMDGQIHDVEAVAKTITDIKLALEEKLNLTLETAAVAAAGRSLKTASVTAQKKRSTYSEITRQEVIALELEAVQIAQNQLLEREGPGNDTGQLFCVGYSVVSYQLEGQVLGSLVGQVGSEIAAEVVATFLPRVVVDSLFSSLKHAGLNVQSLTLEPIAAISVAISANMRMLNLALVDIGAGTSDIALVRNGNVYAYAMVPLGGDELTEKLASHYLLDFLSAEILKRQLQDCETIDSEDILGNRLHLRAAEVSEVLDPTSREIALAIAESILSLNQKAPDAVICVGGGSLTVNLMSMLASSIGLPPNRVGIRTPESFNNITVDPDYLKGPQGVTPLGIAYHSLTTPLVPFVTVKVNERDTLLWNMGNLTVASALLGSGISLTNIYGKPGLGKTLELNGTVKVFKGQLGTPPQVKVNQMDAFLDTPIKDGDQIDYSQGTDGTDARVYIKDLIPLVQGSVWVNGEEIALQSTVTVNGQNWDIDKEIPDRARIKAVQANQLANVLIQAGVPEEMLQEKIYHYRLNGESQTWQWRPIQVKVNGRPIQLSDLVEFGDQVEYRLTSAEPRIRDIPGIQELLKLRVSVNGQPVELDSREARWLMNGEEANLDTILTDGADLQVDSSSNQAILSDIFRVVEIQPQAARRLIMSVNGQPAGFTTPITNGSQIDLHWEE